METVSEDGTRTIRIVSTYSPAQKRATQKYRQTNKEKVNLQRKVYYQMRKDKDPEFLLYKRQKAKEYYLRKKEYKKTIKEELNEPLTEVIEEVKPAKVKKEKKIKEPKPVIEKNNHADEAEKVIDKKRKPKTVKESKKIIMDILAELENKPVIEEIIEEFKQPEPIELIEPEPIVEEVKIEKIKKVKKSKKSKDAPNETVMTIEIDKNTDNRRL